MNFYKITIISNLYPPIARGGAENVVSRIAKELTRQGHEVEVLSTRPRGMKVDEFDENVKVTRFFPLNLYHTLNDHKWPVVFRVIWHMVDMINLHSLFKIWLYLRRTKPDMVLTHNLKGFGLLVPLAIRLLKLKWIHTVHDVQLVIPSGLMLYGREQTEKSLFVRVHALLARMLFSSPQAVVSPSKFLLDFYSRNKMFEKSKKFVLPNPAPAASFESRGERQTGPLRLLYLGQLEPHKGIRFLINTMARYKKTYNLYVAGTGTMDGYIKTAADKNNLIKNLGFVDQNKVKNLFSFVDALVVPSLCYENSPTVIYEALSAGVPVIVADIGGAGELVKKSANGYLFTPGDWRSFIEVLAKFEEQKEEFFRRSSEIRKTVDEYGIDEYVHQLVGLDTK